MSHETGLRSWNTLRASWFRVRSILPSVRCIQLKKVPHCSRVFQKKVVVFMRYWICQLRCITLWKPVCGRCSINELEAREAWTHNRVSETFFLKLSEFTRCNGEISGLSSCVRFSDTHNFGSNCDCGWRKWQMHLYLSSKTTKSHSEVLSPFTLVIFQKLSKEHQVQIHSLTPRKLTHVAS